MTSTLAELERALNLAHEAAAPRPPQILLEHLVPTPSLGSTKHVKLEVFSDEHPPPHFRVSYGGRSANFEIATGQRLAGNAALGVKDGVIINWWTTYRKDIANLWNKTRPTGCTVGEFSIPADWK
ncbi:hypothetical protein D3C72_257710 [compost metagenome]